MTVSDALLGLSDVLAGLDKGVAERACASVGKRFKSIIRSDLPFAGQATLLIELAHDQGWLVQLTEALRVELPNSVELREAVNTLLAAMRIVVDGWYRLSEQPVKSPVVQSGAIADRAQLRGYLTLKNQDVNPRRLLLLSGPPESGKSYSRELIELVAHLARDAFAYIDTRYWDDGDGASAGATHEKVAAAIATKLNLPPLTQINHTTIDRAVEDIARELADRLRNSGRRTWVFIDHMDTSAAKPSVKKLIQKLAFLAANEGYDLRVVVQGRRKKCEELA